MRETDLSHAELPESSARKDSDNTGRVLCPICRKDLHQGPLILLHGIPDRICLFWSYGDLDELLDLHRKRAQPNSRGAGMILIAVAGKPLGDQLPLPTVRRSIQV